MDYCKNCGTLLDEMGMLENMVNNLKSKLDIAQTQVKLLRKENDILRKNTQMQKPLQRKSKRPLQEMKECYQEIDKLQEIIRIKDELIMNQVRFDNISDTDIQSQTNDELRKKIKQNDDFL